MGGEAGPRARGGVGLTSLAAVLVMATRAVAAAAAVRLSVAEGILPRDDDMGINGQAQRAVLQAFRERHPEIEVVRFGGISIQNVGIDTGPLMAIAAGIAPAILSANSAGAPAIPPD